MFQYAFGLSVSSKLNCPLYIDLSFFEEINNGLTPRTYELDIFSSEKNIAGDAMVKQFLHPNTIQRICNRIGINKKNIYREQSLPFHDDVFEISSSTYFEGFFQSEKYFSSISERVKSSFTFKGRLNDTSQKIATILDKQKNTVSIHIRRGDYVNLKSTNDLHGTCSINYYLQAISLLKSKLENPYFYFFSDDSDWVKENLLHHLENTVLIENNIAENSWQDMALMSKCKHHIIANSSFSWWGAWLNPDKEKIIIAPQNWFNINDEYFDARDIIPQHWIKLSNE